MDIATAAGAATLKAGLETLRGHWGRRRTFKAYCAGETKNAVGASLMEASRRLQIAKAQIAWGPGYKLYRDEFRPRPKLQMPNTPNLRPATRDARRTHAVPLVRPPVQRPKARARCGRDDRADHRGRPVRAAAGA
jgi:hypothetical protein